MFNQEERSILELKFGKVFQLLWLLDQYKFPNIKTDTNGGSGINSNCAQFFSV